MYQLLILRLIEAKQESFFILRRIGRLFQLLRHFQPPRLVVGTAAIETHIQHGLVEVLQFHDRELLGQQFEANGVKVIFLTQGLFCFMETYCRISTLLLFRLSYPHTRRVKVTPQPKLEARVEAKLALAMPYKEAEERSSKVICLF